MPKTNVIVKLTGEDGNAFYIMGKVIKALKLAGLDEMAKQYEMEAMAGDYENLLRVTMKFVEVE
ncbi:MAG: hypothetical protein WAX69_16940 [Victivallales bacterium]